MLFRIIRLILLVLNIFISLLKILFLSFFIIFLGRFLLNKIVMFMLERGVYVFIVNELKR